MHNNKNNIAKIQHFLTHGSKKRLLAFILLGAVLAVGLPPVYLPIPALIALSVLFYSTVYAENTKKAFWAGYAFGFGYFLAGMYWISFSLLVDNSPFYWLLPVTIVAIPLGLGLYPAAVCWLVKRYQQQKPQALIGASFLFAALWALTEYFRALYIFPFPWNFVGHVWSAVLPMLQNTNYLGIYGLSLLTVWLATALALYQHRHGKIVILIAVFLGIGFYGYGFQRLQQAPTLEAMLENQPVLRLVQPNIRQDLKWEADSAAQHMRLLLEMTAAPVAEGQAVPAAVIWPETALPYPLLEYEGLAAVIGEHISQGFIFAGGNRYIRNERGRITQMWNSVFVINPAGAIVNIYDKHFLVPFGEYMPARQLIPFEKITRGSRDFDQGKGAQTLSLTSGGLPDVSPLICYEAVFSGRVVEKEQRPQWLLNITNDAWFGNSSAPYQHAAYAKIRAIEEGLPMVRVGNTGISYISDAYGRISVQSHFNEKILIDAPLPQPIAATPFARYGNKIFAMLVAAFLLCAGICFKLNYKNYGK